MASSEYPVCRTAKCTVDHPFELRFVERCYDWCPRWHYALHDEGIRHIFAVPDDEQGLLNRELPVISAVKAAHTPEYLYGGDFAEETGQAGSLYPRRTGASQHVFLRGCVNPSCPLRNWEVIDLAHSQSTTVRESQEPQTQAIGFRSGTIAGIKKDLAAMAGCDSCDFTSTCKCTHSCYMFKIIPIYDKWIYVLTGAGPALRPVWEIYAESTEEEHESGTIFTSLTGAGKAGRSIPFNATNLGSLIQDSLFGRTWHFFLSPVRLGPRALDLLCHIKPEQFTPARASDQPFAHPALQPSELTCERRFFEPQIPTLFEYIPLVDPFAWAAMANEADYISILDAQRTLARDQNEQSKAFIAGTLQQAIHPPRELPKARSRSSVCAENGTTPDEGVFARYHRWSIEDDLCPPPSSVAKESPNIAEAWMQRYDKMTHYLAREVDRAFSRVSASVMYSPGHRVVELSCQEHPQDPDFLHVGLLHWQHLLAEALACPVGKKFVKRVVDDDIAETTPSATVSRFAESIPRANVLRCENLTGDSDFIRKFGRAAPAQVFSSLMPVLIATSGPVRSGVSEPPETISKYFDSVGDKTWWPVSAFAGDDTADFLKESFDIPLEYMQKSFRRLFTKQFDASKVVRVNGCLGFLKSAKAIAGMWGLGVRLKEFMQHSQLGDGWEQFDAIRGLFVEFPSVGAKLIAEFVNEELQQEFDHLFYQRGEIFRDFIRDRNGDLQFGTWEEILRKNKSLRDQTTARVSLVEKSLEFLEKVELVTAILDLISETGQAASAESRTAAIGHDLKAAGAILTIAPFAARALGLMTAAEMESFSPIGWCAALITALGAVVVELATPTDMQLFAAHCFLGRQYGENPPKNLLENAADYLLGPQSGPTLPEQFWMAEQSWAELRYSGESSRAEAPARFQRQAQALLRMLCNFSIDVVGVRDYGGGVIRPGLIPDGGYFEVLVTFWPQEKSSGGGPRHAAAHIFPSMERYQWIGDVPPQGSKIEFIHSKCRLGLLEKIHVTTFPGFDGPADYDFRVNLSQLGPDGVPSRILPATGDPMAGEGWLKASSYRPGVIVRSSDGE